MSLDHLWLSIFTFRLYYTVQSLKRCSLWFDTLQQTIFKSVCNSFVAIVQGTSKDFVC